jgi:hypothetical protein
MTISAAEHDDHVLPFLTLIACICAPDLALGGLALCGRRESEKMTDSSWSRKTQRPQEWQ